MLKGDLYWINLKEIQEKSSIQAGLRLCVVLSNDFGNSTSSTILIAPASSKVDKMQSTHHIILKKNYDELKCDTIILLEQTITINKSNLGDFAFRLNNVDVFLIDTKLRIVLDIYNLKTNNVAREVNKTLSSIQKFDGIISMLHNKIEFNLLMNAIKTREKRLNSLEIFCTKNNINILMFYREPPQLREIIENYKNINKIESFFVEERLNM